MPCFHPIEAYPGGPGEPGVVFDPRRSYKGSQAFIVPCGRCVGCRVARARDWSTRMIHESKLQPENSFVTLTYSDACLPSDGSLSREALQRFLKRLRAAVALLRTGDSRSASGIRYFACGEYGDRTWRPHYHLIVFGFFPPDARKWRESGVSETFRSRLLEEVWPFGHVETGRVTPLSCGYVARYAMKKMTGERAATYYVRPHPLTGQFFRVIPEFALMSRRPGLGSGWFDKFARDAFPSDYVIVDGRKRNVPDYYKQKLSDVSRLVVTNRRMIAARTPQRLENATPERLAVRETIETLRGTQRKRPVE